MLCLVCTSIPHWNWKKTAGSRWMWFGVKVPRTLDYSAVNLNPHWSAPYDHNARPFRQTDRQRMNIMAIAWWFVLMNASRANNLQVLPRRQLSWISSVVNSRRLMIVIVNDDDDDNVAYHCWCWVILAAAVTCIYSFYNRATRLIVRWIVLFLCKRSAS